MSTANWGPSGLGVPDPEAAAWWKGLTHENRELAMRWVVRNPKPEGYEGTVVQWAYDEGPDVSTWLGRALLRLGVFG